MPNLPGSSSWTHTHTTPPLRFAVERVDRSHTHKFNIVSLSVTKTSTHIFDVTVTVTGPILKTHKYTIRNPVLVTKRHRFNSGGNVYKLKTHKFNIASKISSPATKTHRYNVKQQALRTKIHKYNVVGRLIVPKRHLWTSAGRVKGISHIHKYHIVNGVALTNTHKWNILTPQILDTDLENYKSSNTAFSLGGAIDTNSPVIHNTDGNLFDSVTAAETSAGDTEYRCIYMRNTSTRTHLANARVWLASNSSSPDSTITIALGTSAINGIEQTVENEGTAPTGVSWSTAAGLANALTIGTLNAGDHKALWIRRVISAGADAYSNDNFTIGFGGDSFASE